MEDIPENTLSSSIMKASCALVRARPASSQALDERESGFLLVLVCHALFFRQGVISSTEVAGDATLVALDTEATRVMRVPFSTTYTTLFLRFEKGLFFLALILPYIS